jgi:hypothetical protein
MRNKLETNKLDYLHVMLNDTGYLVFKCINNN